MPRAHPVFAVRPRGFVPNITMPTPEQLFPQPPARCWSSPSSSAIIGLADGYSMSELGGLFYSARRVMTPDAVNIVMLSNVNESTFSTPQCSLRRDDGQCKQSWLSRLAVQLLRFTPSQYVFGKAYPLLSSPVVYRFFLYHTLAQTRCHRRYLFVDTRDIFFQADPFASAELWNDAFVVTLEAEMEYSERGEAGRTLPFGGPEPPGIFNIQCVGELWGKEAARLMPSNESVVSSGVLGGGGASLRHFLGAYLRVALEAGTRLAVYHPWVTDQIILNYVVRACATPWLSAHPAAQRRWPRVSRRVATCAASQRQTLQRAHSITTCNSRCRAPL